jgi:hypothetical protein
MEALGKGVDVIHHRVEQAKIWRLPASADLTHEMKHAVQYRRERAVFFADDSYRLHAFSILDDRALAPLDMDQRTATALEPDQRISRSGSR